MSNSRDWKTWAEIQRDTLVFCNEEKRMKSKMAIITFLEQGEVDPGYGVSGGGRPDNSLPGYGRPDNSLPGRDHIWLPVFNFDPTDPGYGVPVRPDRPDNSLPSSGARPDNSLPSYGHVSPGPIVPGRRFIVKWVACFGMALVPDNSLPETPEPK